MPFTFSHPAIVLPFRFLPKQWFSMTGLIIGSVTPDFEYFLRMKIQSQYSHTITGLLWFDLPLGLLLSLVFHNLIRESLFNNLPSILKSRLLNFLAFDFNKYLKVNWIKVVISILIGTATHILWDGFTHDSGFFVSIIPELSNKIQFIHLPVFRIIQHLSTLIGGFIVVIAILKLPVDRNISKGLDIKYWITLFALSLVIILTRLLIGFDNKFYGHLIATSISAVIISLTLTPFIIRDKRYELKN
jgi:hypothetical protein